MHLPAAENFIPNTVIEGMSCPGTLLMRFPLAPEKIAAWLKPLSH
jgi:hypothetical protein